jgi:two-component system chemotaxis sensor kinase CheA
MSDEDEFLQSLRATFKVEAGEHLQAISTGLLELERVPASSEQRRIVEVIFRAAHSLKGAARAVNFSEIETICQSLEDVFASWKRQDAEPTPAVLDSIHRALDTASQALAGPAETAGARESARPEAPAPILHPPASFEPPPLPDVAPLPPAREHLLAEPASAGPSHAPLAAETVRIAVAKLDARLLEAEEMLTAKLATAERVSDLGDLVSQFEEWRQEWGKLQPEVRTLRQTFERPSAAAGSATPPGLARLVDFFDWSHDYLRALEGKVTALRRTAVQDHLVIGKLVDDLLEDSKKMLMLPLSTVGGLFPKLVRDLCRDQGKEADLVIRGGEVEIDKRILEEMKDPLIHLLRNCIDHGIETPAERRRLGKPPRATITLAVSPVNGSKVELLVSDDGGGIDAGRVKASAIRHGRISAEDASQLDEAAALDLIFQSDVSTSPIITQLSGRGLGLAIVREKAEKLGGRVFVESRRQAGTTIRIALPIALATFRGIVVEAAGRLFVIPTTQVERVARFKPEDVRTVEGHETLALDGRAVSLVRLAEVLALPAVATAGDLAAATPFVLLGSGDQRIAFAIDHVRGEQEVLVKPFNKPLSRVRNIAGATVLGSGQVAPILNVFDLLKSARQAGRPAARVAAERAPLKEAKSILVSEDSITSRALLKGILESAGYRVKTAVDGMEAFTALRAERFDLLVSDVEMPRLNGFDLTARVRADNKLAALPVILVTALETREDRERGIDVGANAYLIKSSFDQSNLLEAVRRLI